MALVFVAKDMQVANPIGQVNVHPLPEGLPSGLVRAHLMRHSLKALRINLVDGRETTIIEDVGTSNGDISYGRTSVGSTHAWAGWRDDDYAVDYNVGYTWLVVGRYYTDGNEIAPYVATASYAPNNPGEGEDFAWRDNGARFGARRGSESSWVRGLALPIPDTLFMGFGGLDRSSSEMFAYVPHTNELATASEPAADAAAPPENPGLLLCRSSSKFSTTNNPTDSEMAFFAAWGRPLNQSEMLAAYNVLKPWLLARGVEIA